MCIHDSPKWTRILSIRRRVRFVCARLANTHTQEATRRTISKSKHTPPKPTQSYNRNTHSHTASTYLCAAHKVEYIKCHGTHTRKPIQSHHGMVELVVLVCVGVPASVVVAVVALLVVRALGKIYSTLASESKRTLDGWAAALCCISASCFVPSVRVSRFPSGFSGFVAI